MPLNHPGEVEHYSFFRAHLGPRFQVSILIKADPFSFQAGQPIASEIGHLLASQAGQRQVSVYHVKADHAYLASEPLQSDRQVKQPWPATLLTNPH